MAYSQQCPQTSILVLPSTRLRHAALSSKWAAVLGAPAALALLYMLWKRLRRALRRSLAVMPRLPMLLGGEGETTPSVEVDKEQRKTEIAQICKYHVAVIQDSKNHCIGADARRSTMEDRSTVFDDVRRSSVQHDARIAAVSQDADATQVVEFKDEADDSIAVKVQDGHVCVYTNGSLTARDCWNLRSDGCAFSLHGHFLATGGTVHATFRTPSEDVAAAAAQLGPHCEMDVIAQVAPQSDEHTDSEEELTPDEINARARALRPGRYVLKEDVMLGQDKSIESADLQTLKEGVALQIMEVCIVQAEERARGRVEEPAGWISIMDLEDGWLFAQCTL